MVSTRLPVGDMETSRKLTFITKLKELHIMRIMFSKQIQGTESLFIHVYQIEKTMEDGDVGLLLEMCDETGVTVPSSRRTCTTHYHV